MEPQAIPVQPGSPSNIPSNGSPGEDNPEQGAWECQAVGRAKTKADGRPPRTKHATPNKARDPQNCPSQSGSDPSKADQGEGQAQTRTSQSWTHLPTKRNPPAKSTQAITAGAHPTRT